MREKGRVVGLSKDVVVHLMGFLEARDICKASQINKTWNRASKNCDKRWKELFERDFQQEILEEETNQKIPTMKRIYEKIEREEKMSWKEKYKQICEVQKEEKIYSTLFYGTNPPTPRLFGKPIFNPLLQYSNTKQLPSLYNPLNYFRVGYMLLAQIVWFWYFTCSLSGLIHVEVSYFSIFFFLYTLFPFCQKKTKQKTKKKVRRIPNHCRLHSSGKEIRLFDDSTDGPLISRSSSPH